MDAGRDQWLILIFRRQWHIPQIKHKVSNLSEKLILVDIPFRSRASGNVWIRVDESDPCESITTFDRGRVVGISDELCVVILDDWRTDLVRSLGKENYCTL